MQTIQLDLKKNPDIADFLVDKQPGDGVTLHATIKSLDDQTCTVTIEEIGDEIPGDEEKKEPAMDQPPGMNMDSPQAGASPDAVRDIAGGEQSAV